MRRQSETRNRDAARRPYGADARPSEDSSRTKPATIAEAGDDMAAAERRDEMTEALPEEGAEPARIPTSLTATLREQGPRYLSIACRGGCAARCGPAARRPRREDAAARGRRARSAGAEAAQRSPGRKPSRARGACPRKSGPPSITDLLREGQEIIVQIAKEPLGQKGARITSHIALPGRFLVYMPTVDHIGVSRKIPSDEERQRLEARPASQPHRHSRRLHRAHRRRWPHRRRTARRHDVPLQHVAGYPPEGREEARARC